MKLVFVVAIISIVTLHFLWVALPISLITCIWGAMIITGVSISLTIGRKWMKGIIRPNDGYEVKNIKDVVKRAQFFTNFLFLIFIPIICSIIVIIYGSTLEDRIGTMFPRFGFVWMICVSYMIPSIGLKTFVQITYRDIFIRRYLTQKY